MDSKRVLAWLKDPKRKPAHLAFTEGDERQAAYLIEEAERPLSKHADEGWGLATHRTKQLRQAVEALRGADHVLNCWAHRLGEDHTKNVNLRELREVLEWAERMFPKPEGSLHDLVEPVEEESVGEVLRPGESIHDLPT